MVIKNHTSEVVRGARAGWAPHLDPLVEAVMQSLAELKALLMKGLSILKQESYHYALSRDMTQAALVSRPLEPDV